MKLAAIIDVETTGTDPSKDRVVELGVITWSIEHRCTVRSWSTLVFGADNAAEAVNGIPAALIAREDIHGVSMPEVTWRNLQTVLGQVDVALAHNAGFDRSFLPESLRDLKPWICTQDDVEWPRPSTSQALIAIALAHGVGVTHAHRALTDCDLIARLLERASELTDIDALFAKAMRPKRTYRAKVGFENNHLAKERGFRWMSDRKMWVRRIAEEDVATKEWPFALEEVAA